MLCSLLGEKESKLWAPSTEQHVVFFCFITQQNDFKAIPQWFGKAFRPEGMKALQRTHSAKAAESKEPYIVFFSDLIFISFMGVS